jgi:hypothetical protein
LTNGGTRTALSALGAVVALLVAGAVSRAATSVAGSATFVPGTVGTIYGLEVALADNGDAVAVWVDVDNSCAPVVRAAIRPAGHRWGRPQSLSHAANAGFPDLASVPTVALHTTTAFPLGSIGRTACETLQTPDLAVDRRGNAFAVWGSVRSVLPRYSRSAYLVAARYRANG